MISVTDDAGSVRNELAVAEEAAQELDVRDDSESESHLSYQQ